jgi:hypothetical protein
MDSSRFDALARSLTLPGSRRRALALALSGALGVAGLVRSDDAAAGGKCKPKCKECTKCKKGTCKDGKCKKGKCKPAANGTPCSVGTCQGGICECASGTTACAGGCVNTRTDPRNCGSCGRRCAINQLCLAGICTCPGTGGAGVCSGQNPGATCCLLMDGSPVCSCAGTSGPDFVNAATCTFTASCPPNTTACIGGPGTCRTCCPLTTTCDTATGACLQ